MKIGCARPPLRYSIVSVKSYSAFIFGSYGFHEGTGEITLHYALDSAVGFTETVIIPPSNIGNPRPYFEQAIQALHIIGGISYYKTYLPKTIVLRTETLDAAQAEFWNAVYENGLGEFFYENKIDFRSLINFPTGKPKRYEKPPAPKPSNRILVPVGGGKDSIVTIEMLRKEGKDITLLRMGSHPLIDALIREMKLPCITVTRRISGELFAMNAAGALNGHIPITAYLSFLAVVVAELYGFDAIAMSNEKSADEGNVEYLGTTINHQWSKSAEFEELFCEYLRLYIDPALRYWSPLRDMTELQIVGEFAKYPQYFELFTSCNKNWKIAGERQQQRWCCTCPKCAFAFCLLAAHLPKTEVLRIFGKNLFDDASLLPLYRQLLGLEGFKPFECVGTPEETKEAFAMIRKRGEFKDSAVLKALES